MWECFDVLLAVDKTNNQSFETVVAAALIRDDVMLMCGDCACVCVFMVDEPPLLGVAEATVSCQPISASHSVVAQIESAGFCSAKSCSWLHVCVCGVTNLHQHIVPGCVQKYTR